MITSKWCDACECERADYKTQYTDETSFQFGTLRVEVWVQDLCKDCHAERVSNLDKVTSYKSRLLIGNAWTTYKTYN
jgi:hypothetical protein